MTIDVTLANLPESVSEATIQSWYKKPGDRVQRDEIIADIETDKVILEIPAPADGVLSEILTPEGSTVVSNTLLAHIELVESHPVATADETLGYAESADLRLSPAVRNLIRQHGLDPAQIVSSGKEGRILKGDVIAHLEKIEAEPASYKTSEAEPVAVSYEPSSEALGEISMTQADGDRTPRRVKMTRIRAKIAERLVESQQSTALLTTFNEVDMSAAMSLRKEFGERFQETHQVRLGFMSFFVRAATEALKKFPIINAATEGDEILYHDYYDIGIAVSSDRGLVVPILRDTDRMGFADIEGTINRYAQQARDGNLGIEDMTGGTFTITNGGVFGSMLSTPIINPPQSAILGLHKIEKRPVVVNDEIVIRPMMYLALSYDHRIIDGSNAVRFLVAIKERIEQPSTMLLEV